MSDTFHYYVAANFWWRSRIWHRGYCICSISELIKHLRLLEIEASLSATVIERNDMVTKRANW